MKLSNKILIGFFGFIFLYLSAVFAEIRFLGSPNAVDDTNSIAETVDLSGIAYLKVNGLEKNISVVASDQQPRLEVRSLTGGLLKNLTYTISGDTLTLLRLELNNIKMIKITVFVHPTSLKGIIIDHSAVIAEGLQSEHLQLSQTSGRIWMSGSQIEKLELNLSSSTIDFSGTELDTLSATMEKSTASINTSVGVLRGSITDGSYIGVNNASEIQLKKDESSRLALY